MYYFELVVARECSPVHLLNHRSVGCTRRVAQRRERESGGQLPPPVVRTVRLPGSFSGEESVSCWRVPLVTWSRSRSRGADETGVRQLLSHGPGREFWQQRLLLASF
ncbi:hypothetical protein CDAR_380021 [Caerostris darwini]|uniref:Uncharacterized protein n=1 Tax=Caerostris darwini TaxID=1538125 RepID=A0AAV4WEJ4_9ARAC|nr:hypothetical protein CDAR_380021 [Caerostris darwini]